MVCGVGGRRPVRLLWRSGASSRWRRPGDGISCLGTWPGRVGGRTRARRNLEGMMCPDQTLQVINDFAGRLGRTPSYDEFTRAYNGRYISPITTHFGWTKALRMAGMVTVGEMRTRRDRRRCSSSTSKTSTPRSQTPGPRQSLSGCYVTRRRTRLGWRLTSRQAAAMLVAPMSRWMLMARLRRVAMTAGPLPVRTWEWSSAKITSRIGCSRLSMVQCPRRASAIWSARVSSQARSVTA